MAALLLMIIIAVLEIGIYSARGKHNYKAPPNYYWDRGQEKVFYVYK
jgi:hypothetical protein